MVNTNRVLSKRSRPLSRPFGCSCSSALDRHVALLHRPYLRSLRRRALLRPRGGTAAEPARPLALVPAAPAARHQGKVAGLGAVAIRRPTAAPRRRRGVPRLLCRPRQLADPDRGSQYPARPHLGEACVAVPPRRPET